MDRRKFFGVSLGSGVGLLVGGTASACEVSSEKSLKIFSSISDLKSCDSVVEGDSVMTQGYHQAGDGGGGQYLIQKSISQVDGIEDASFHLLVDNLQAELLHSDNINVLQYGASRENTNTAITTNAIVNANVMAGILSLPVFFPSGTYSFSPSEPVRIQNNKWFGANRDNVIINCVSGDRLFNFFELSFNSQFYDFTLFGSGINLGVALRLRYLNSMPSRVDVQNIKIQNFLSAFEAPGAWGVNIENLEITLCGRGFTAIATGSSYFTTFRMNKVLIDQCEGYGLSIDGNSNLMAQTVSLISVAVQKCGIIRDYFQAKIENVRPLYIEGWHGEGSPAAYGLIVKGCYSEINTIFFYASKGIKIEESDTDTHHQYASIRNHRVTGSGGALEYVGENYLHLLVENSVFGNSSILGDVRFTNTQIGIQGQARFYDSYGNITE